MIVYTIILGVLCIILLGIIIYLKINFNNNIDQYIIEKSAEINNQINKNVQLSAAKLNEINKEIIKQNEIKNQLLEMKTEQINEILKERKKNREDIANREIDEWIKSAQEVANEHAQSYRHQITVQMRVADTELEELKKELNKIKQTIEAVNQSIANRKREQEQENFYCIQLSDDEKQDLETISSLRGRLKKFDFFNKLIYNSYIKKPVDEMIKRVLEGEQPCGIYKITRLKTGEVYIGQSTNIKNRWQQHCKSCYHCGTISYSILHKLMEEDGIWNWKFELVEKVPKEALGEREKFWINFYDSKKFGLNEKNGG